MWRKMLFVPSVLFVGVLLLGHMAYAAPPASASGNELPAVSATVQQGRGCSQVIGVKFGDPAADPPLGSANHNLLPNQVCISKGGTVNFTVYGFHTLAMYKVKEEQRAEIVSDPQAFVDTDNVLDFTVPGGPTLRGFIINDPAHRIFLDPGSPLDHLTAAPADVVSVTLKTPGRYLAICVIKRHFLDVSPLANGGMFGFVDVDVD